MTNPSTTSPMQEKLGGRNLYLIGMMGSGKSCTGRPLAELLNYGFVDTDSVIEQLTKKPIEKIFDDEGEESFRDTENQVLNEIGKRHSLVVATGGGIVTKPQNWGILHQGIVIWLNPSQYQLIHRLKADTNKRPLLQCPNPWEAIDDLLDKRRQFYAEADLEITIEEETATEVARKILKDLPSVITNSEVPNAQRTIEE